MSPQDLQAAKDRVSRLSAQYKVAKSLLLPPPAPAAGDETSVLGPMAKQAPDHYAFLAGGRTLNPMIQQAVRSGATPPPLRQRFEQEAASILQSGAVGFGEFAALHFSFTAQHPFEVAPPDHPLFLALMDIAAKNNVPIDLHMEAVAQDKPMPSRFKSPPNPTSLQANIASFERMLAHESKARIVWQHAGWDNTGDMTVDLLRRLLTGHGNLFLAIKEDSDGLPQDRALDENSRLRPEWLDLISSFPDRFMIGTDAFYGLPNDQGALVRLQPIAALLAQLPSDLARKVATENAVRVYNLR